MENLNQLASDYYPYLADDFNEVLGYLPLDIIIGAIGALIVMLLYRLITGRWQLKRFLPYFLFFAYAVFVIQLTYLSRDPGSRIGLDPGLGDTWEDTLQSRVYVIENVLLFIPFGLTFPLLGRVAFWTCLPLAALSSIAIELMQYYSQRGYCQLDDVVANTAGAAIGYLIVLLIYGIYKIFKHFYPEE